MSDTDSEDDLPILQLIKKRKESAIEKAKVNASKKIKTENNSTKNNNSSSSSKTTSNNKSTDFYEFTKKGLLIQRLLCRWWYAIEWPKMSEIPEPPSGYEPLDGFPGVFISTSVDSLGTILDLRNPHKCPNLKNLSKVDSAKLKKMVIKAYEKQMEILVNSEGEDVRLLRILRSELREIKQVDTDLADKEAKKYSF